MNNTLRFSSIIFQKTISWSMIEAQDLHLVSTGSVALQIKHRSFKCMSTLKLEAKFGLREMRSGSTEVLDKVTTLKDEIKYRT